MQSWIRRFTKIELVLIYLVIIAGSVVRMTGSGMGCPDWPKCFGYLIPPSDESTLRWSESRPFQKGNIIIVKDQLKVAKQDFTTASTYDPDNWETYTKHDYAKFNAFHTWTEYINRLIGALSGVPMLILVALGLIYFKIDRRVLIFSFMGLVLLGFEAWLGKLVVDGNLIPGSITIHMLGALMVVAVLIYLLSVTTTPGKSTLGPSFVWMLLLAVVLTLLQIILGTQVREQIDVLGETELARVDWIGELNWEFYVHRSFSILLVLFNAWIWFKNRSLKGRLWELNWVMVLIVLEVILGVILNYAGVPEFAQPLHLLLGTLLFAFQFHALLRVKAAG